MKKTYFRSTLLMGAFLATSLVAVEPYDSVHTLPQTPYFVQDSYILFDLANSHQSAVIIDVESSEGSVARYLAQQANNLPSLQKVYSVNMWESNDRAQKRLFQRFLSNVVQENTSQVIIPIRMSSHEAAESLNVKADLITLVGANDHQTICNDILGWYPHLSDIGVVCGNNWNDPTVESGVTKAAALLNVTVHVNNNVWYILK